MRQGTFHYAERHVSEGNMQPFALPSPTCRSGNDGILTDDTPVMPHLLIALRNTLKVSILCNVMPMAGLNGK